MISRSLVSVGLALLLAGSASAQTRPGTAGPTRPTQVQTSPGRARVEGRLHRFRHLEGTWRTEDAGLKAQFVRTAEALVERQVAELKVEAAEIRERERERTQRRTPAGARDLQDLEPAHIPAVVLAKIPL